MKIIFRIDIDLATSMCIYGYSYTILIPILLICIIPFKLVSTLALLYFLIHSCTFLFFNMYLVIQEKAQKSKYVEKFPIKAIKNIIVVKIQKGPYKSGFVSIL